MWEHIARVSKCELYAFRYLTPIILYASITFMRPNIMHGY